MCKHSGHRDFDWAVEINRFYLGLVGLWPETNQEVKNSFVPDLHLISVLISVVLFCVIPVVYALVRVWGDMILMIDNLQVILPVLIAILKIIVVRWKRPAFVSIMEMMAEDWMKVKVGAERDVMMRQARNARLVTICGYCITMSSLTLILIFPYFGLSFRQITNLTDGDRLLLLPSYYTYNTDKSPQFELTYVTQVLSVFLGFVVYTSVDLFLGVAIFHIYGQLENFKRRLSSLIWENFDSGLRNILRTHLRLIRFARNIEDMFSLMLLGIVLYSAIIFCLYGFLLLTVFFDEDTNNTSPSRKCFAIFGAFTLIWHTFLYCCAGEMLIAKCEAVYCAICDLEWYKLEAKKGRSLVLLLMRTSDPFRFTAGGIIPLTMSTFCSILKTSAGYISFLLAKRD